MFHEGPHQAPRLYQQHRVATCGLMQLTNRRFFSRKLFFSDLKENILKKQKKKERPSYIRAPRAIPTTKEAIDSATGCIKLE